MKNKCEECGNCCCATEMILSARDIARINKNDHKNLKPTDFVEKTDDGFFQLKNINGHCIFFDFNAKICKIYELRPQGCRFYPLTFNLDIKICVFDDDCPKPELFYPSSKSRKTICKKLIKFLEEQVLFTKLR